ncbi:SARP family transcriptional regulator [Lentzea sp. NBRC 105346]|nr:SARP family transcriptional regulator [Lentzea sp. NBRC 105346]
MLGPLTVSTSDGTPVAVGGARLRTLLAVLLFHTDEPVSVTRLVEALWEGAPPKSYLSNLHTYVSRLRDRLNLRIEHFDARFRLVLTPGALDLQVFRDEAERARRTGDPRHYRAALEQWRDRPLLDLSVPVLEPEIARLEATRLTLVEECFDAELAAGHGAELVGELQATVTGHPTRERLWAQLMTALCAAGRPADALAAYRQAHATLTETLGVEPSRELRQLHEEILRGEPPTPVKSEFPICQLPPDIPDFAGRDRIAADVADALRANGSAVPVVVLTGEPGVGKTVLALRVAHRTRADFPDGQLFTRLAGASPEPKTDAPAALLRAIGVAGPAIPEDLDERAALLRARLAGKRVLVVLDDAASPEQVVPLLPGTPGCAVLITSRRKLSGLVGAQRFAVLPFDDAEAHTLLEQVVGRARVQAEPGAAAQVVALCGNLPLALRIAATRLATRPHLTLAFLAKRLVDERRRLDELAISGLQVRASVTLSYRGLTAPARTAFRRLGLLGPHSVAAWAPAALLDTDDVDPVLEELVEASLLDPAGLDAAGEARYRMHDLLRVFGRERAEDEDPAADRLLATRRLLDTALTLADEAARAMPRSFLLIRLADGGHHDDPVAWFTAEQNTLVNLVRLACAVGWHREAAALTERLTVKLWSRSEWAEMRALHQLLRDAGDDRIAARADFVLTLIDFHRGHYDHVAAGFERCRVAFERLGDRHALACTLSNQAHFLAVNGEPERSLPLAHHAVELFRAEGDGFGEAAACRGASIVLGRLGRLPAALAASERALALARKLDETRQVALALTDVAWTRLLMDDLEEARSAGREAVALFRSLGERSALANALYDLGLASAGGPDALRCFEESLGLAEEIGERPLVAAAQRALACIGVVDAGATLEDSLATFRELGAVSEQVTTLRLIAQTCPERAAEALAEAELLTDERDLVGKVKLRALLALCTTGATSVW